MQSVVAFVQCFSWMWDTFRPLNGSSSWRLKAFTLNILHTDLPTVRQLMPPDTGKLPSLAFLTALNTIVKVQVCIW